MCELFFFLALQTSVLLTAPSRGEILDNLTKEQEAQIEKLSPAEQHFLFAALSGKMPKGRRTLLDLKPGEFFTVQDEYVTGISQVIDDQTFLGSHDTAGTSDEYVWVSGTSTKAMTDGKWAPLKGFVFYCTGNRQYGTALGGTNTVMEIQTIQGEAWVKLVKPFAEAHGFRIWGEDTPNPTVARFLKSSRKTIKIENPFGKSRTIRISKLSPLDKKWVASQEE